MRVIALVLFFLLFGEYWYLRPVSVDHKENIVFTVYRGEGLRDITNRLQEKGLIRSARAFMLYALMTGRAGTLKPGAYQLSRDMSASAIAQYIARGGGMITVTIPEGATIRDTDHMLGVAGVITPGNLIEYAVAQKESIDGFLFPDTYIFSSGTSADKVVQTMRINFDAQIGPLIVGIEREAWYQTLILASLIEKEATHARDRLMISGVLQNRLALGMPLQIDAANVYIKCGGAYTTCSDETRKLTQNDLAVENPYNTYRVRGVPPTPIVSPGKEAMIAALNPQRSSYLYYISNPRTGRLIFAETLEAHNENRRTHLP